MRIILINIDRRTDRLQYMERQLRALGMEYERLSATVPETLVKTDVGPIRLQDALRRLSPGELATSVSHFRAWQRFLEAGEPLALILEDDVQLSQALPAFLTMFEASGAFPEGLVRVETRQRRHYLGRRISRRIGHWTLHHPYTWEWGAAAYIISASLARRILASELRFDLPIDDTLLSPTSPLRIRRQILQSVPALAFVPELAGDLGNQPESVLVSDVAADRSERYIARNSSKPLRSVGQKSVRELKRIGHQLANIGTYATRVVLGLRTVVPFDEPLETDSIDAPINAPRSAVRRRA